jgi:hypothetical protein
MIDLSIVTRSFHSSINVLTKPKLLRSLADLSIDQQSAFKDVSISSITHPAVGFHVIHFCHTINLSSLGVVTCSKVISHFHQLVDERTCCISNVFDHANHSNNSKKTSATATSHLRSRHNQHQHGYLPIQGIIGRFEIKYVDPANK